MSSHRFLCSFPRMLLPAVALLGASASAQFDDFAWSLAGDPSGSFSVTSTAMHVVGPAAPRRGHAALRLRRNGYDALDLYRGVSHAGPRA